MKYSERSKFDKRNKSPEAMESEVRLKEARKIYTPRFMGFDRPKKEIIKFTLFIPLMFRLSYAVLPLEKNSDYYEFKIQEKWGKFEKRNFT